MNPIFAFSLDWNREWFSFVSNRWRTLESKTASESTLNWRRVNTRFRFIYIWSDLYSFFIWRNYHGWAWLTTNLISKFSKISSFPQIHANWGFLAELFFRRSFLRVLNRNSVVMIVVDMVEIYSTWFRDRRQERSYVVNSMIRDPFNLIIGSTTMDRTSSSRKIVSFQGSRIAHFKWNKLKCLKKFCKIFLK